MKIFRHIIPSAFISSILLGISYCTLQYALGAKFLLFSGLNVVFPALGFLYGPGIACIMLCLKKIVGYAWVGSALYTPFTTYIPTLSALLYWKPQFHSIRLLIPLFCMVAFLCHPVGGKAWVFTFYWLIPMIMYFIKHKSLFMHALSATFMQHAVGAVLWLYAVPTTPELWYSLIPLVLVERLLFATGTVVCIHGVQLLKSYYRRHIHSFSLRVFPFFHF